MNSEFCVFNPLKMSILRNVKKTLVYVYYSDILDFVKTTNNQVPCIPKQFGKQTEIIGRRIATTGCRGKNKKRTPTRAGEN